MEDLSAPAIDSLRASKDMLTDHALDKISANLPWYRALPTAQRAQIEHVARHGVTMYVDWVASDGEDSRPGHIFSSAPATLTGTITLGQTLALVRTVIDVVQEEAPKLVPSRDHDAVRVCALLFGRDVGFAAAELYARAAEARGAWDARLESMALDAMLHDDASDVVTRAGAAGWTGTGSVIAVVAHARLDALAASRIRHECRTLVNDCVVSVRGDSVMLVLGLENSTQDTDVLTHAAHRVAQRLNGPTVIGPVEPSVSSAGISLKSALAGLRARSAWLEAPNPVRADDLLPERLLNGDVLAREQILTLVAQPLHDLGDPFEDTVWTYLSHGASLEATARALFVHANTVRYRLGRVSDVVGWDATDPRDALVLHLAIMVSRLAAVKDAR
ncbi:PucR family transcriptional regulator [Actinomyces vulturis]|uniref:PucR family transcriptional regulator n=1 Tax=Actinomyces vulturis TaxID=1857645 RepID=UPI000835B5FC|nr:helix-turn-helix domain-containing protein [Actinomyces vulturis]